MDTAQITNTNLSPFILIMNGIISFQSSEEREYINIMTPTIRDSLYNTDFQLFMSILYSEPENFKDINLGFTATNKGELLIGLMLTNSIYKNLLIKYFLKYIIDSEIRPNGIFVGEQKVLGVELQYISNVILISMGYKKIEDFLPEDPEAVKEREGMSEAAKKLLDRQLAAEAKLKRIKEKQSKQNKSSLTQEGIFLAVMYEFHISREEIKNMNYYTIS